MTDTRPWNPHKDPPRTAGRHPFVVVGKYRGGTLLHLTDDSMVEWTLAWGISTNHVTALCGLDTRKAVPELLENMEQDGLRKCPRCWRAA